MRSPANGGSFWCLDWHGKRHEVVVTHNVLGIRTISTGFPSRKSCCVKINRSKIPSSVWTLVYQGDWSLLECGERRLVLETNKGSRRRAQLAISYQNYFEVFTVNQFFDNFINSLLHLLSNKKMWKRIKTKSIARIVPLLCSSHKLMIFPSAENFVSIR